MIQPNRGSNRNGETERKLHSMRHMKRTMLLLIVFIYFFVFVLVRIAYPHIQPFAHHTNTSTNTHTHTSYEMENVMKKKTTRKTIYKHNTICQYEKKSTIDRRKEFSMRVFMCVVCSCVGEWVCVRVCVSAIISGVGIGVQNCMQKRRENCRYSNNNSQSYAYDQV